MPATTSRSTLVWLFHRLRRRNLEPASPSLDRNRIHALAELKFIDRTKVVHFIGPPGTGKSHLSVPLGVEAVKAGRSMRFLTLADLVGSLAKAEREGILREKIRFCCRFARLIVDEIGYLPVVPGEGNLFFQLVNARYESGAMILTSNRGFAECGKVFGDPVVATALLDRLLQHAVVVQIEGASYRLRQHADLVPEHIRSKALIHPPPLTSLPKRRGRPQRWHDAVAELLALQAEYAAWCDTLPESLSGTATAEALNAIVELNLSDLAEIQPPRDYGRD